MEIYYRHFTLNNGGHLTIAYNDSGDYGYAFCSPEDQFCRAIGRDIAVSRLGNNMIGTNMDLPTYLSVLIEMLYYSEFPQSMKHEVSFLVGKELMDYIPNSVYSKWCNVSDN